MKKVLSVAFLIMVFVGLWLAILGYVEASSSFRVMVVVGLLVAVSLSVVTGDKVTETDKWVIIRGKVIGMVDVKNGAKEVLSSMGDEDCFAIATRGLDIVRAAEDGE